MLLIIIDSRSPIDSLKWNSFTDIYRVLFLILIPAKFEYDYIEITKTALARTNIDDRTVISVRPTSANAVYNSTKTSGV